MTTKTSLYFLRCLLAFLGLGVIGGGGAMVMAPSGKLLGAPLSMLNPSPFHDLMFLNNVHWLQTLYMF